MLDVDPARPGTGTDISCLTWSSLRRHIPALTAAGVEHALDHAVIHTDFCINF